MPDSESSAVETSVNVEPVEEYQTQNSDSIPPPLLSSSSDTSANNDAQTLVAVPEENQNLLQSPPPGFGDNRVPTVVASPRLPPKFKRPNELVKVALLEHDQWKQHRELVKRARMIYNSLRNHFVEEEMKHPVPGRNTNSYSMASKQMQDHGMWINQEKRIVGLVPGVEIGDMFFHRLEMCVVGLHGQKHAGIDHCKWTTGEPIATSIVVSSGDYEDDEDFGNVLVYTGQGGQDRQQKQCQNQKRKPGNLAMECSMYYGVEIRVIRGLKYDNSISSSKVYVYDGLYKIVDCQFGEGKSGCEVYKFKLVRIEGQPEMGSEIMKFAQILRSTPLMVRPAGYLSFDISNEKENVPVYLYNDIDDHQESLHYEYIEKSVFPPDQAVVNRTGCDCIDSCNDDCLCARKNGGEFAYDNKGHLLRGKPVVFECGEYCKCGPSCNSRVTQKGLRKRLEVFRTKDNGWGVRTLDLIEAGAFICEYAGVVVTRNQAEILSGNEKVMVHPGQFPEQWVKWGDLSLVDPTYVRPNYPSLPPVNFAMDVSKFRNVASFIRHCKEPNVMVQFVLRDHTNLMFPRVMLFAMENISPLAEKPGLWGR